MRHTLPQNLRPFIWHFLKPYKGRVVLYIALAMFAGFWGPFNSMLIKHIINILSSSSLPQAGKMALLTWPAALLVLNFLIFDNVTWRSIGYLNYKYQPVIKNTIISSMFHFVLGASHQFFNDHLSGRLASQINALADNVESILHRIATDFVRGLSMLIIALITMYYVHPTFFYVLALWCLIFTSFSIYMSKYLIPLADALADAESAISGQLVDNLSNAHNVRIFARRTDETTRLDQFLLTTKEKFQKTYAFKLMLWITQGLLIAIMLGFMVYFLIHLYGHHLISIGDFALILGLGMEVGHITWHTMYQVDEFNQAVGKCKQSLSTLIVPQEVQDKPDAAHLLVPKGQITFSSVKFHYKDTQALFQKKSVTIHGGQKVGLVGYSGGGKSTFVHLILRLYDVIEGHILIDGQDIRDVSQDSLHKHIAMIPQDPSLFHRSLMENIRYGRIDASDEETIDAAKKAHAHEFITQLPLGYKTLVGERGVKLSGGQRQRIAIARAILKNAPILILDEATSQLDSITENDIQDSLWALMQDKTTIVVAHRLSTLLHMDRIMVFDQGKIIEDGNHTELLTHNGLYKMLWSAQVGGFLPDKKNE